MLDLSKGKVKFGEFLSKNGWGSYGLYYEKDIEGKDGEGRDIVKMENTFFCRGEGWDGELYANDSRCNELVETLNSLLTSE